jgi:ATP-dependent Clp protease ATP-binding subunit ClpA
MARIQSLVFGLLLSSGFIFLQDESQYRVSAFTQGFVAGRASTVSSSQVSSDFADAISFGFRIRSKIHSTRTSSSDTTLKMVIERMSSECVGGIQKAHDIGSSIGLMELRNEILFCGMVDSPERAAKTLIRYRLDNPSEIESAAIRTLQFKLPSGEINLKGDKSPTAKESLPFAEETRFVLNRACEIADSMESQTVRSEHVILALMGYNGGEKIEKVPILDLLGDIPSLKQGLSSSGFSVTRFCQDLVNALPNTPISVDSSDDIVVKDTVVVGGRTGGGGTSTLKDVGIDLTQLALEGKLDMVYGRDKEIRSGTYNDDVLEEYD